MTASNFCYWLQGGFELGQIVLDENTRQLIERHRRYAQNMDHLDPSPAEAIDFLNWLGGALDMCGATPEMGTAGAMIIRSKLSAVCMVIDKSNETPSKPVGQGADTYRVRDGS